VTKKTRNNQPRPPIAGTIHANIQLPEALHEAMKAIRQARHELEGADVKLCRIYREAVEQYVNAKPQQRLLNHGQKSLRAAG
jgi:hypothetical protein